MRRAADPAARLALLRDALKKVGRKKQLLNADEMAAVAGMTWRNMKPQVEGDHEFPVDRRGSEGVAWQFDAGKVLKHMIARLEEKQRERDRHSSRVAKMAGVAPELAESGIPVAELLKIDQLQTNAQRRKIEQGEWVRRDDHRRVVTEIFTVTQSEVLAFVSRIDPAGRWPAAIRGEVSDAMRSFLVHLHDQVKGRLTSDAGPAVEPRRRVGSARGR